MSVSVQVGLRAAIVFRADSLAITERGDEDFVFLSSQSARLATSKVPVPPGWGPLSEVYGMIYTVRRPRILCVEDDPSTLRLLILSLEHRGFAVEGCESWRAAAELLGETEYDAILLDRGLPDGDGVERVREMRAKGNGIPVVMFTARIAPHELAQADDAGVFFVLPKPQPADVVAWELRRLLLMTKAMPLISGAVCLDARARTVAVAGRAPEPLSPQAVDLLWELMMRPGVLQTREYLVGKVSRRDDMGSDHCGVLVHAIRKALGQRDRWHVGTVRKGGFYFVARREDVLLARSAVRVPVRSRR